jgi:uncharacterized membrane protein YeiH
MAQRLRAKRGTSMQGLVLALDLGGTFVFALGGAMAGIGRRLDIFGVLVLSFAAATFGGVARDLLIGAVPPAALVDLRYLAVALFAGVVAFFWTSAVERLRYPILIIDAAGLALFSVAGAQKALAFGINPVMAALLGMVTGIGGGIARDVLLAEAPSVLKSDVYALAGLAGAAVVVAGPWLHLSPLIATVGGGLVCFSLRLAAIRWGWRLPTAPGRKGEAPPTA